MAVLHFNSSLYFGNTSCLFYAQNTKGRSCNVKEVKRMKKMLTLITVSFIVLSMFLVLARPTRATSDVPVPTPIDTSDVQVCNTTETPGMFACATPLPSASPLSSSGSAYDEQLGLTFVQNFSSITFGIIAVAQHSTLDHYGPAYLVNGLTNVGYWYQAGLAYDWPTTGGYAAGFYFVYEVFAPNGTSIFPSGGGGGLSLFINGTVNAADFIIVSLSFSGKNVTMSASDSNTGAYASQSYSAENAAYFEGLAKATTANGMFSGLMTEWYHSAPYFGKEAQVTYYNSVQLSSAGMWMDEFAPGWNGNWSAATGPFQYSNPNQLLEATYDNATEYSDAYVYISGALALCAMKTRMDGYFYVPNPAYVNATSLRVEMLFTNSSITGDQTGAASPYPAIANYPDGTVDMYDATLISAAFGSSQGSSNWNYMADVVPDGTIDIYDAMVVSANLGNKGSYSYNLNGIQVLFSNGQNESLDAAGFVTIPSGATSFNVTQNGIAVGAMIVFCGS
jgi:hypothetical protein